MQQMQGANIQGITPEACAAQIIEVVPLVMRRIRAYMRAQRTPEPRKMRMASSCIEKAGLSGARFRSTGRTTTFEA